MTEAEQAEAVAQHLATAAACADQAQIFCALDFDAEIDRRRGLAGRDARGRPALQAFRFLQRLLNDPAETRLLPADANAGVAALSLVRRDGLAGHHLLERAPGGRGGRGTRGRAPGPGPGGCRAPLHLRLRCPRRACGPPSAGPSTLVLPAATTPEAGGAVRVLL